ncbi:MAG: DNA (cytosine-5-)-methyltransferase [Acidimicrobiia bacterium]
MVLPPPSEGDRSEHRFRFVDLFAGIGGFHHALAPLGGHCELAVEIDPDCQRVYKTAFPETRLVDDIRTITRDGDFERPLDEIAHLVGVHDVLCAGFPCQPFSKSGAQHGVRDRTRGTLFFDIMSIVLATRPEFVILENVRNIAGPRHRDTWRTIIQSLREAGYRVADEPVVFSPHLLPRELGGTAQVRDRVFVLARRLELDQEDERVGTDVLVEHEPVAGWAPTRWSIEDFLDDDCTIEDLARYRLRPEERCWVSAWQAFVKRIPARDLPGFPIWVDEFRGRSRLGDDLPIWKRNFIIKNRAFYRAHQETIDDWLEQRWKPLDQRVTDFPASRRKFEWQARSLQTTRRERDLRKLLLHFRPSGIRVRPPTYVPALVAITQTSIVGSRMRRLTPLEAARLQGIPDHVFAAAGIDDKAAYRQLGNAVNVGVARHVAGALFRDGGRKDWAVLPDGR